MTLGKCALGEGGECSGGWEQLCLGAGSPGSLPGEVDTEAGLYRRQDVGEAGKGEHIPNEGYSGCRHGGRGIADPVREEAVPDGYSVKALCKRVVLPEERSPRQVLSKRVKPGGW